MSLAEFQSKTNKCGIDNIAQQSIFFVLYCNLIHKRVFPLLYKVDNVGKKGLHKEEQKNSANKLPPVSLYCQII